MMASRTSGERSWTRVLFSRNLELLISLNLMTNSVSRLAKMEMRSISLYRIFRVRWASTMVGLLRVCFRLLMI